MDSLHSDLLNVKGNPPFNAEPPVSALVEFNYTPEDLVYCRNHGPVLEFNQDEYFIIVRDASQRELFKSTVSQLRKSFPKAEVVAALQVTLLFFITLQLCKHHVPSAQEIDVGKWHR
jgi:sulfite oxidase